MRNAEYAQSTRVRTASQDSAGHTYFALLLAVLRAAPLPLAFLAVGHLVSHPLSLVAGAISTTFTNMCLVTITLSVIGVLCEEDGVAPVHFNWRAQRCARLRTEARWLTRWGIPIATLASFIFMLGDDTVLLGRLALILSILLLLGHFTGHVVRDIRRHGGSWLSANHNGLRLLLILLLVVLLGGVVVGLRYSVGILAASLVSTLWVGLCLVLLHYLLARMLRVVRRRIRFAQAPATRVQNPDGANAAPVADDSQLMDLSAETQRLLNVTTISATVIALLYIWAPLFPIFEALNRIDLWSSSRLVEGEPVRTPVTLATLLTVIVLAGLTFYAAQKLPALLELLLRARTGIKPGIRYAASTLLSYAIFGAGLIVALSALGLQWSQLQWLVAALGVGIGFGLQEIVANFISGLIILFERPIRVGDVVTVGGEDGTVTKIRIRATTIRDFDGRELLVPNKEFITGRLLNWSLTDVSVRVSVSVGIAYGSDVGLAHEILTRVAKDNPNVVDDPAPSIVFHEFGDNTLNFTSRCFIDSVDNYWTVTTALHNEIYRRFTEAGIVIAYPQRDVHLDSAQPLRVVIDPSSATAS